MEEIKKAEMVTRKETDAERYIEIMRRIPKDKNDLHTGIAIGMQIAKLVDNKESA